MKKWMSLGTVGMISLAFSGHPGFCRPAVPGCTSFNCPIELAPVTWTFSVERIGASQADLIFVARMESPWHIHSQRVREGGPLATKFAFEESDDFSLMGSVTEPGAIHRLDAPFRMFVGMFDQTAIFRQRIHLWYDRVAVKGFVRYMTCNDTSCLPPQTAMFDMEIK